MAPSRFTFDYTPLNRPTSFALLLLVLYTISTSLNLLVKFVGIDGQCLGQPPPSAAIPSIANLNPPFTPNSHSAPNPHSAPSPPAPDHRTSASPPLDHTSPLPAGAPTCNPTDTHTLSFASDSPYRGWGDNVTKIWRELVPPNSGLGQDDDFNNGIPYGIAIFHQLHCLYAIREHLTVLMLEEHPDLVRVVRGERQRQHMNHCFDWLRQSLLCHADATREHMVPMPDGTYADQTVRVCGNADKLYEATKNPKAQTHNIVPS